MGVDLRGVKKKFASLMDEVQPMVTSQFVIWLDEKVAEFKVQGYMDLDTSLEAPKWIKDYSMSMLVSGVSLTAHSNGNDEDRSKQRTPSHRKEKLWSTGSHSPNRPVSRASMRKSAVPSLIPQTVQETIGDLTSDSSSNASQIRKRLAPSIEEDNDDDDGFEIVEVKRERLNSHDNNDVTYELRSPETSRTNTDSLSKSAIHNKNLHSKMGITSSSTSKVSHVRTLNSQSLNTLASRLSGVLASQKQTHSHPTSAVKSPSLLTNQISKSVRLGSSDDVSAVSNNGAYSIDANDDIAYSQDDAAFDMSADMDENPAMNMSSEDNSDTFVMTQGALRLKGEAGDEQTQLSTDEFYTEPFLPKSADSRMLVPVSSAHSQDDYSEAAGPSSRDDDNNGLWNVRTSDATMLSGSEPHQSLSSASFIPENEYDESLDETAFKCPYCDHETIERDIYRQHLYSHFDRNTENFSCVICNSTVRNLHNFVRHVLGHSKQDRKRYVCELCGNRTFSRSDYYRYHMMQQHGIELASNRKKREPLIVFMQ